MKYLHHGTYYPSLIILLTAIKREQEEAHEVALWLAALEDPQHILGPPFAE